MPQETLGYVEMEWTCQRCGTKNPGLAKTCANCGAQMDAAQQFDKPAEAQLISDAAKVEQAKQGADVHCPFCGTRNVATAKVCTQCGGDLTKAQARQAGQVGGAYQPGAAATRIKCPACSTENPASAANCQNCGRPLGATQAAASAPAPAARPARSVSPVMIGAVAVVGLLCLLGLGAFLFLSANTSDVAGVVQTVHWERSVGIEQRVPAQHDDWRDRIPTDGQVGVCELKPREFLDAPDPNRRSEKVCGTPYTVDLGNGTSKVVQDCRYQVYDDYCAYTVMEWKEVDRAVARGDDLSPYWPPVSLAESQREGGRNETYAVSFAAGGQIYDYTASTETEFAQFAPGSSWTLKVNGLGGVNAVEPAR